MAILSIVLPKTKQSAVTTTTHRALLLAAALLLLALSPWTARAQDDAAADTTADPIADPIAELLPEADIVLALEGLTALREHHAGKAVARALRAGSLFTATERAWSELAATLDLENDAALDALLGRRAMLAIKRTANDPKTAESTADTLRWALVAEVSRETEDRLRRRLRPVPRAMLAGRALLTLERGTYELTSLRPEPDATHAMIVLAPAGSRNWLAEVVEGLESIPLKSPDPGLHLDVRASAGVAWQGWAALEPAETGFRIEVHRDNATDFREVPLVQDPSVFASVGQSPADTPAPLATLADAGALGLLDLVIRRAEPMIGKYAKASLRDVATGEVGLVAWHAAHAGGQWPAEFPTLDLGIAIAMNDADAGIAIVDLAIDSLALALSRQPRTVPLLDSFSGAFPGARRSIRLVVAEDVIRGVSPGHATLAWRVARDSNGRPWCVVAASRDEAAAHSRLAALVKWVATPSRLGLANNGWGRVAGTDFADATDADDPLAFPPLQLLRRIDQATLTSLGNSIYVDVALTEPSGPATNGDSDAGATGDPKP